MAAFVLLVLLRAGHIVQRQTRALATFSTFILAYMVALNTTRYAFGVRDFVPAQFSTLLVHPYMALIGYACAFLLAVLGIVLLIGLRSWPMGRQAEAGMDRR